MMRHAQNSTQRKCIHRQAHPEAFRLELLPQPSRDKMTDARDTKVSDEHHVPRVNLEPLSSKYQSAADPSPSVQTGHWLSQDKRHHHKFLNQTLEHVDANPTSLQPVLAEFKTIVEQDTRLYMLFNSMFQQVRRFYLFTFIHPDTFFLYTRGVTRASESSLSGYSLAAFPSSSVPTYLPFHGSLYLSHFSSKS